MTGDELWVDAELEKNKFKEKQTGVGGTNPTILVRTGIRKKNVSRTRNVFL